MPLTTPGASVPQTLFVTVSGVQVKVTSASFVAPSGYVASLNAQGDMVVTGPPADSVDVTITSVTPPSSAVTKTVKVLPDVDELGTVKDTADGAVAKSLADAKGDLFAATSADTVARLAVGTTGQVLTANPATATGLAWAAGVGGTGITAGTTAGQVPVWDGDSYEPQLPTPVSAVDVPFTPTGTIASTNVQAAIAEVASEAGTGSSTTVVIYKTANQTVNNSTTLVNDTGLVLPIAANQTLVGEVNLFFHGDATADFKYALLGSAASITVESAALGQRAADSVVTSQVSIVQTTTVASGTTILGATTSPGTVAVIKFRATAGANAGNVLLQWAQSVLTAADTVVRLGSNIIARPVA